MASHSWRNLQSYCKSLLWFPDCLLYLFCPFQRYCHVLIMPRPTVGALSNAAMRLSVCPMSGTVYWAISWDQSTAVWSVVLHSEMQLFW